MMISYLRRWVDSIAMLAQKTPGRKPVRGWNWWRRRDSCFPIFRQGLDYSFTCRCRQGRAYCE